MNDFIYSQYIDFTSKLTNAYKQLDFISANMERLMIVTSKPFIVILIFLLLFKVQFDRSTAFDQGGYPPPPPPIFSHGYGNAPHPPGFNYTEKEYAWNKSVISAEFYLTQFGLDSCQNSSISVVPENM